MDSEERRPSLADQAASWVPPWDRSADATSNAQPDPDPADERSPEPDPADERSPDPDPADERSPEPEPAAETESRAAPEAGPDAEAEPEVAAQAEFLPPPDVDRLSALLAEPEPAPESELELAVEPIPPAEPEPESMGGPASVGQPALDGEPASVGQPALDGEPVSVGEPPTEASGQPEAGTGPAAAPPQVDDAELRGALEAIMLVVDEPVTEVVLAQVLEQPTERIAAMLTYLSELYGEAGHGFELRRAAGGWRLYTRPQFASYVERFVLDGQQVRLTQAALETLAVVAYKQPVTRSRISAIRGVNCDGVIRTLLSRGLIEECGTEPDSGAYLYRTTSLFLEKLGIDSVTELPPLAPFLPDDVDEIADAQQR